MVGVDQWSSLKFGVGPGGGHRLDDETCPRAVKHQEAVAAGQIGCQDRVAGLFGGRHTQGFADHRRPHHSGPTVGGEQVVDPDAHSDFVHPDLAQASHGGEYQRGGPIVGADPEQHNVVGGRVVHVPGLAEEA